MGELQLPCHQYASVNHEAAADNAFWHLQEKQTISASRCFTDMTWCTGVTWQGHICPERTSCLYMSRHPSAAISSTPRSPNTCIFTRQSKGLVWMPSFGDPTIVLQHLRCIFAGVASSSPQPSLLTTHHFPGSALLLADLMECCTACTGLSSLCAGMHACTRWGAAIAFSAAQPAAPLGAAWQGGSPQRGCTH